RNVKNGSSPQWLQRRLRAIGLRPINALVDITNFITYDRGRPLHVFDAAKVHGDLTVRCARNGETLLALDAKPYTLAETMCIIAGNPEAPNRTIDFPLREVPRLAGLEADRGEITGVLAGLGFSVAVADSTLEVSVPSWRGDIEGRADIVEEVVRILGVDRIPA